MCSEECGTKQLPPRKQLTVRPWALVCASTVSLWCLEQRDEHSAGIRAACTALGFAELPDGVAAGSPCKSWDLLLFSWCCAQQPFTNRSVPACHAVPGQELASRGLEGLLFCPCHNCSLPKLQNNLMEGLQNGSSQPWSLLLSSCELTKLIVRAGLARLRVAAALYPWGILS